MAITKIEVPELFDFGSDNSAFKLPTGTTAERPTSPSNGEMRFNTTTGYVEYYDTTDTQWWEIDYETVCTTNDPNYPITNLAYYKMSDASDSGEGSGYIGQGGIFNGSSSYIDTTYTVPAVSTQSISVWFKTTSTGNYRTIFSDAPSNGAAVNTRMQIYITPTSTYDVIIGNNSGYWIGTGNSISSYIDGNWHNLIATYNGTDVKIYIDGSLFQSFTSTISFGTAGNQSLVLGKAGLNNVNYWNGSIDQIRIFPTALSSSNVSLLYAETSATSSTLDYPVTATALYELSGNANDTGNTYNGTATNVEYAYNGTASNVNFNVAGKFGNAGEFNGSSSGINTPIPFLNAKATSSVSLWVKYTDTTAYKTLFQDWSSNNNWNHNIIANWPSTGNLRFFSAYGGSGGYAIFETSGLTLNDGNWHHIVSTVDLTTNTLTGYVDGVSVGNVTVSTNAWTGVTQNANIGNENGSANFFNGSIDQVRIFDSALNASQVTQLYNEIQCVPTIVPSESFNTVLYTGDSTARTISTGFAPDLVWIKNRNNSTNSTHDHSLFDSVRTTGYRVRSNSTGAANDYSSHMSGFTSGGFNLTTSGALNDGGGSGTYVSWNWKAGGAAVSNTDGTITSQVSANVDAGFSIVSYTGNATSGATIGHGLSQEVDLVIVKNTNLSTQSWNTYVKDVTDTNAKYLMLNSTNAINSTSNPRFIVNNFSSTVFSVGNDNSTNGVSGTDTYIAYAWHSVDGFSKIGSYVGTGATGNTIVTGFEPAWVIIKSTSSSGTAWNMWDNKRTPYDMLRANTSESEFSGPGRITFSTTGFQLLDNDASRNSSGGNYIFMAFAADPT